MSAYTTNFHTLINLFYTREEIESWFSDYELSDFLSSDEIDVINSRGTWSKEKLAKKIVDNYMFRELGFETIGLFKHYAKNEMNQLMEEFLPLIYSSSISYNPLDDVDYREIMNREINRENQNQSNSKSTGDGLSIYSDTPQGQINKSTILNGSYATNTSANETESNSSATSSGTSKDLENQGKRVYGRKNTNQRLIDEYRKNIIAIDKKIIEKLNILFMGIYEEA